MRYLLLLALLLPSASYADDFFAFYFLEGRVIKPSGEPLRNTELILHQDGNRRYFKTDLDGHYKVQIWYVLPCGTGNPDMPLVKKLRRIENANEKDLEFTSDSLYTSIPTRWKTHYLSGNLYYPVQNLDLMMKPADPTQIEIYSLDLAQRNSLIAQFREACVRSVSMPPDEMLFQKLDQFLYHFEIRNRSWTELFSPEGGIFSLLIFRFIQDRDCYILPFKGTDKSSYRQLFLFIDHYAVVRDWSTTYQQNFSYRN